MIHISFDLDEGELGQDADPESDTGVSEDAYVRITDQLSSLFGADNIEIKKVEDPS